MTGFVKTEHRQRYDLLHPLTTLSCYLCFPALYPSLLVNLSLVLSTQKSITASFLQLSLFMCPAHIISAAPFDSHLSLHYIGKIRFDVLSLSVFFGFFLCLSVSLTVCVPTTSHGPATFLTCLFLSLCRHSMQSFYIFCYFKLAFFFPSATHNPIPPLLFLSHPLLLPDSPPWCCMHFITFGSTNLKKKRIYANGGLKNECSPPLQCAEESREAPHYNIFSSLWICRIIIKNDLWCWNEHLLPGNSTNMLVILHMNRHGDGAITSNLIIKQSDKVMWATGQVVTAQ